MKGGVSSGGRVVDVVQGTQRGPRRGKRIVGETWSSGEKQAAC